ncbi:MAG: DUF5686 and carboxypeptidase regulatory-like domain-containing protein [Flavobacteriaceae bacterium]|nr:DUF5686 and carboxypeptidase regulatory-like domain-containing protein [Flavobacteriaceae bacterium]
MLKKTLLTVILFFSFLYLSAQVKVSGVIVDEQGETVPFCNIIFKGSIKGTISDENGKFYLESDNTYSTLEISFLGFETKTVPLKKENYNLKIVLQEERGELKEVVVYTGKIKKKGNPAIAILKKIWERKRKNGVYLYDRYEYDKYEKIEFDLNNIDDKLKNSRVFKGMELIFNHVDTSAITGKAYLPIFINESVYEIYGKNILPKKKSEKLVANKNSGFSNNQGLISFVKQLYVDYDIYDNYLKFFDKSFASPLSKLGPGIYNYVLTDSSFIDNKWCYNILFYPRRKNELTFKGDFWVNDTTFAVKEIQMHASKSANINWVKEIYIEQDFTVLNDSVFLLKRDHFMSDFSVSKKDESRGVYGKRTTLYDNHVFNVKRPDKFYKKQVAENEEIYNKSNEYWHENRQENLSKDEVGIYKMLDTLQHVKRFKELNSVADILTTGYWSAFRGFEMGPIFSTIGFNDLEGLRLRLGGRTYFKQSDRWRMKGYLAYGFKDQKFKYGIEGQWMVAKRNRLIFSLGTRRDIEQLGVSLTTANEVLDRSFATTSIFSRGDNLKLSSISLTNVKATLEPVKNLSFRLSTTYKTIKAGDPTVFNIDYYDEDNNIKSDVEQVDATFSIQYTPKRKPWGSGVDRGVSNAGRYPIWFLSYTRGVKGILGSDFDYHKLQFRYHQPIQIGLFGKLKSTLEIGKTFNPVPLALMNIVPGNQTYFISRNSFGLLDFYEFITDEYASLHLEHNFNGRLFSKIPFLRKLQWREIIGVRGVVGRVSDENIAMNFPSGIPIVAPEKLYWEYHVGIANIFKLFRIDFEYRGSYRDVPEATKYAIKGGFSFYF